MKKITAPLLILVILFSSFCGYAMNPGEDQICAILSDFNIMKGDPDGNMRLDDPVTRAEFTKIAMAASQYRNAVAANLSTSPFRDVNYQHWAAPYIKLAVTNKIISGYPDGTFLPENYVTYEEAATVCLKLLGYTDEDFSGSWPYGQVGIAQNLELNKNVSKGVGEIMSRRDVANMIFNLLDTNLKDTSTKYISVFDAQIVEDIILIATSREDPSVGADRIYTSNGTYKINQYFDYANVGYRGDAIIKNTNEIISFTPYAQETKEYTVTSTIGSDLVLDGQILNFDENLTVYNKSNKTTYQALKDIAVKGDTLRTYLVDGALDYALLISNSTRLDTDINSLEKYVIYSQVGNSIVTYDNGVTGTLNIADNTTVYENDVASTYGAIKSQLTMGDVIYVKRDTNGDIEYANIETDRVEGPFTVKSSTWYNDISGDINTITVMRDGEKVTANDLQVNDIVYFSSDLNMAFAYSKKVTGIYESASPNKDQPTSVTVSGVTYELEGVAAFNALSSNGSFKYGDTITLLLGKSGEVADVMTQTDLTEDIVGYLTETGSKEYTDNNDNEYTSYYIKVVRSDGSEYEYTSDKNYSSYENKVVRITFNNTTASVKSLTTTYDNDGKVDMTNYTFDGMSISPNVTILDVTTTDSSETGLYTTVFQQRLDGVSLSRDNILYLGKNTRGEITEMFLLNATGDAYQYGIVTKYDRNINSQSGTLSNSTLEFDINGTTYTSNGAYAGLYSGLPVRLVLNGNSMESIRALTAVNNPVSELTSSYLEAGGEKYELSPNVVVYNKTYDYKYLVVPLADILDGDQYTISGAYYDKAPSKGGQIRVIVVTEQ